MPPSVRRFTLPAEAALVCAGIIKEALLIADKEGRPFILGLSGGQGWKAVYFLLTKDDALPWRRAEFYWADEAYVGCEHKDSVYRAARDLLFKPLGIKDAAVHAMPTAAKDPDADARRYETMLRARWPKEAAPPFDIVLLGAQASPESPEGRWVAVSRMTGQAPPATAEAAVLRESGLTEAHEGPRVRLLLTSAALGPARRCIQFTVGGKKDPSTLSISDRA